MDRLLIEPRGIFLLPQGRRVHVARELVELILQLMSSKGGHVGTLLTPK